GRREQQDPAVARELVELEAALRRRPLFAPVHQPSLDAREEGLVVIEFLAEQQILYDLRRRAQVEGDDDTIVPYRGGHGAGYGLLKRSAPCRRAAGTDARRRSPCCPPPRPRRRASPGSPAHPRTRRFQERWFPADRDRAGATSGRPSLHRRQSARSHA